MNGCALRSDQNNPKNSGHSFCCSAQTKSHLHFILSIIFCVHNPTTIPRSQVSAQPPINTSTQLPSNISPRSHIQSFRTIGQLLIIPSCPPKTCIVRVSHRIYFLIGILGAQAEREEEKNTVKLVAALPTQALHPILSNDTPM